MPNQKPDIQRWKARKGATDARIATMLAEVHQRAESSFEAFFNRLSTILTREECCALDEAWAAGGSAPAAIWSKVLADTEAKALWQSANRPEWLLSGIEHNMIPSEHYVYQQTGGKLTGPNGEK
jgi:hypothetical protein